MLVDLTHFMIDRNIDQYTVQIANRMNIITIMRYINSGQDLKRLPQEKITSKAAVFDLLIYGLQR